MADPREDIMQRLEAIGQGVAGIAYVTRNNTALSERRLPAMAVLEGDEEANENDPPRRPPMAIRRVSMTPEIYVLVASGASDIGGDLNALRSDIINAVLSDIQLRDLTHDGVGVRYLGMATGLAYGRSMQGEMSLRFALTYVLNPAELG